MLCTKRSIECLYSRPSSLSAAAKEFFSSLTIASNQNPLDDRSGISSPRTRSDDIMSSPQRSQDGVESACIRGMRSVLKALNASHGSLNELTEKSCGELSIWSTTCIDAYLKHFHPHWPIIHSPTFELDSDTLVVSASVVMIGCWLEYPESTDELVITVHEKAVDKLFRELVWNLVALSWQTCVSLLQCKPGASQKGDLIWQIEEYQAVILNVIFAFYSNVCLLEYRGMFFILTRISLARATHCEGNDTPWSLSRSIATDWHVQF